MCALDSAVRFHRSRNVAGRPSHDHRGHLSMQQQGRACCEGIRPCSKWARSWRPSGSGAHKYLARQQTSESPTGEADLIAAFVPAGVHSAEASFGAFSLFSLKRFSSSNSPRRAEDSTTPHARQHDHPHTPTSAAHKLFVTSPRRRSQCRGCLRHMSRHLLWTGEPRSLPGASDLAASGGAIACGCPKAAKGDEQLSRLGSDRYTLTQISTTLGTRSARLSLLPRPLLRLLLLQPSLPPLLLQLLCSALASSWLPLSNE